MIKDHSLALVAAGLISFPSILNAYAFTSLSPSNPLDRQPFPEQRQEDLSSTQAIADKRKYAAHEYIENIADIPLDRDNKYKSFRIRPKSPESFSSSSRNYDRRAFSSFSSSKKTF
ncbi:MAG: hypothetical protein WCK29_00190 [archaeon]